MALPDTYNSNQAALALADPQAAMQPMTPMDMIQAAFQSAIERGAGLEVVDRILQQQREMMEYQDRVAFNTALARVQAKARRVKANAENSQTRSRYANFAALDKELRPLYIDEGLALSFDTAEIDKPDTVRVVCDVSLGGYSRRYHIDMPADGKGAKGNDVMTKTHATGSAISYGKRYLLLMIFNLSVGENDDDGNNAGGMGKLSDPVYLTHEQNIKNAHNMAELTKFYLQAIKAAGEAGDRKSIADFEVMANHRKKELK